MMITQELKLYFCKRGENDWEGGLLICAHNWHAAKAIYTAHEDDPPVNIREIKLRQGVIYDDDAR